MAADDGDSPPDRTGKTRLLTLADLDRRTKAAQQAHEVRDAIIGDLGGEEQLSTLEVLMVENAAVTTAVLRDMQCRWLRGEDVQVAQMATLENTFNRTAQVLGTSRRAKDVTPASMRTELMKRDETDEEA